ncbi:putative metallo-hydrolase [Gordonia spumicola]|uniref:Putative metallo-hydrolase n=1 Tax=Gordonia spumicola TaxID=589161 RepID=A0A7I9V3T0_9ACTN|nr:MBL fold metallo-hydrolase [Gordonia spumicola]GEE00085.1 putative metallo-hydrolase [Gordonia spumicola]
MTIHHLNCGTMHPIGGMRMVCHVLLVETDRGLMLVDTGLGVRDVEDPAGRIGTPLSRVIRPDFSMAETALAQVSAHGFAASDVTDIVMTHLDSDHAGGIDDFPGARLHVSAREFANADSEPGRSPAVRYRPWRRTRHPDDVRAYAQTPDDWFGFAATALDGFGDDIAYVALPGHTAGHMGVAIRDGERWLLHGGDAFYHRNVIRGGRVPRSLAIAQFGSARQPRTARDTRRRLADLHERHADSIRIVCAHDSAQLDESAVSDDT